MLNDENKMLSQQNKTKCFHSVCISLVNLVPLYTFGQYYKLKFYNSLQYTDLQVSTVEWEWVLIIYQLSLTIKSNVGIVLPKPSQKVKKVGRGSVEVF